MITTSIMINKTILVTSRNNTRIPTTIITNVNNGNNVDKVLSVLN